MLVSIITPLYNSEKFISEAISSIQNQSYKEWEMIVVDDCSSDNSVEVAKSYANKDCRIRIIELGKNSGAAIARNTAIEAAKGRYIAFLDSDDLWLPGKLENQLKFMQKKNISFSFAAYEKINEFGVSLGIIGVPEKVDYQELLKCCVIGCLTAMYDTHKVGKIYMPLIRKRQDFGLWLKILKKTEYAYGIQQPLAKYRIRTDSISSKKSNAAAYTWRLYREVEGLNVVQSCYYFSNYAVRGVLRKNFPKLARYLGVLD